MVDEPLAATWSITLVGAPPAWHALKDVEPAGLVYEGLGAYVDVFDPPGIGGDLETSLPVCSGGDVVYPMWWPVPDTRDAARKLHEAGAQPGWMLTVDANLDGEVPPRVVGDDMMALVVDPDTCSWE